MYHDEKTIPARLPLPYLINKMFVASALTQTGYIPKYAL